MKFTTKIGKIEEVKSEGRVKWSSDQKSGEIKVRYEDRQKIFLVGLGKIEELKVGELQEIAAKLGKRAKDEEIKALVLETAAFERFHLVQGGTLIQSLVEGFLLGEYEFKKYKTSFSANKLADARFSANKAEKGDLGETEVTILVRNASELVRAKEEITKAEIYSEATCFARDLVNEPSSVTTPSYLADLAMKMAGESGFKCQVFGKKELEKMGMGCLLGVARGSDEEPKFIRLEYGPPPPKATARQSKTIVLVGKGITFDSGGLSLKTQEGMETMKMDMAGAAAILGIFSVVDQIKPKYTVIGLIPCTENMPSGKAIKPGDVIKSYNGKTIEVLNTDAEGRLILADALAYGATLKPDLMIDLATLTGACITALGEEIAGLFTKDEKLKTNLLKSADEAGEKFWPLPLENSYKELLKSEIADLKNVSGKKYGGAITAALFLEEFVDKISWAHLDIAGPAWEEKGTDLIPKGGSGFGVRTILSFLSNLGDLK